MLHPMEERSQRVASARDAARPRLRRALSAAALLLLSAAVTGCDFRQEAISLSNWTLDFSRNETPFTMYVWNNNPLIPELTVGAKPDKSWILVNVDEVVSNAPADPEKGPFDRRVLFVRIDRTQLDEGEHTGKIVFSSKGIKPKEAKVRVVMDADGRLASLNITNATSAYSKPYLIDFMFGVTDKQGNAVVAEPAQFVVEALEGDRAVGNNNGLQLRRASTLQLRMDLLMDYSQGMQERPGAVAVMEGTARDILLPALNMDAQVGITEFHRDDQEAQSVSDFSVDRAHTRARIGAIQSEYVRGFYSGARLLDAVITSCSKFEKGESKSEARYVVLFSDGYDTSSAATLDDAVERARDRSVRIFAVGCGEDANLPLLLDLTGRTGGAYFPADTTDLLPAAVEKIVQNLEGQYILRWASLSRRDEPFRPSFSLILGDARAGYKATADFNPDGQKGDVLRGKLRVQDSGSPERTTVLLRADYMPRFIHEIHLFVRSDLPFSVSLVEPADEGLLAGWSMEVTRAYGTAGYWVSLESPGPLLSFASFGPLVRFDFEGSVSEDQPLFEELYVDNGVYEDEVALDISGFDNPTD